MRLKIKIWGFLVLGLVAVWINPVFGKPPQPFPFAPGEKLTFVVKWVFIPAGEATLEVSENQTLDGKKARHFVLRARTYTYLDPIYKARDTIEGYTDMGMTRSLLYRKIKEGRRKKNVTVHFDWESMTVQYLAPGEVWDPVPMAPGSFDPLSVFYAFRLNNLQVGQELDVHVADGKKCVQGKAKVIRRERIKVPSGEYDTFLVVPDLEHIGGVFKKSKDAQLRIWVTADHRRMPVKVQSKVAVGSFVAELVHYEKGKRRHAAPQ
jgi:hypothetical protein